MDYRQTGAMPSGQPVSQVIGEQFDQLLKRLDDLGGRLNSVAVSLYGPEPSDANAKAGEPRPLVSYASRVRDLQHLVDAIEGTVNRIKSGL